MNAQQILFSAPMVGALLAGRKTQTRRVVKAPAKNMQRAGMEVIKYRPPGDPWYGDHVLSMRGPTGVWGDYTAERFLSFCPYGGPGDLLWVRETWALADWSPFAPVVYRADDGDQRALDDRWRPSIHMPRWASRVTLRLTNVHIEPLQAISEEDAIAEGIECVGGPTSVNPWADYIGGGRFSAPSRSFQSLWESINGTESWQGNQWVWALSFDVLRGNIAQWAPA